MGLLVFLLIFDIIEMVIKMKDTIIYLIRHSEQYRDYVYNNAEKESEINKKIVLSIRGEEKAKLFANKDELKNIDVVYSSDYARAVATAKYIAFNNKLTINIDERLGERKIRNDR